MRCDSKTVDGAHTSRDRQKIRNAATRTSVWQTSLSEPSAANNHTSATTSSPRPEMESTRNTKHEAQLAELLRAAAMIVPDQRANGDGDEHA